MKTKLLQTLVLSSYLVMPIFAQNDSLLELNKRFSNLPQEERQKYFKLKSDANRYFNNKRIFESMMKIYEMRTIFDKDPQASNLLGSIHIEFRNFSKAREIFENALETSNNNSFILFNLAEIDFCTRNWKSSLKRFEQTKEGTKKEPNLELNYLIDLKIMLCHLALSKESSVDSEKVSHLAKAKKFTESLSYLNDSPSYYYAHAALAFYEDDTDKANGFLRNARTVFGNNINALASWNDTFIEYGYISSHYGFNPDENPDDIVE